MSMFDAIYIPLQLFVLAVIIVFGYFMLNQLYQVPELHTDTAAQVLESWKVWDTAFILVMALLSVIAVILAYFVPTHPAFLLTEIILLIVSVLIAPQYSNMYAMLAQNPATGGAAENFPSIAHIIGLLPSFALIISAIIAIITYGKIGGGRNTRGI